MRSAFSPYPELTQLLNDMNALGRKSTKIPAAETIDLPDSIASRIITLSRAFRPYWYIDSFSTASDLRSGDEQTKPVPMVFLSPERGLLLKALLSNRLDVANLESADFSFSDMRGAEITGHYSDNAHYAFPDFGSCSALDVSKDLATSAAKKLMGVEPSKDSMETVYLWDLGPLTLENSDFSKSKLSGVLIGDEHGTVKFNGARLANVKFINVKRLDLTDADIFSVSVDRFNGQTSPRIIVSGARFMNEPLCSTEQLYRSEDDLSFDHPDISIEPKDAKGVYVREDLVERGFLSSLEFDLNTRHSSGVSGWDFELFRAR